MKDNFHSNTDLLEPDDRSDDLAEYSHLTELRNTSTEDDLLSNWNADDDDDSLRDSQLYDQLLNSNALRNASGGSATYVPEGGDNSILGSFLSRSFLSKPTGDKPAKELQLPELGDDIFGFHLLSELGEGTFARVFLAKQGDLADREVVLKVSAIEGSEPQTLAQLQHTHVVPIYSAHEDEANGLRAVCMPYFGGASLNRVLEEVWRKKGNPATGQHLIEALDRASGPEPATRIAQREAAARLANTPDAVVVESPHTARSILSNLQFVQASAWIIARLAEGLQHSHERNVIHRDIKPSNVLLSAEGQPLLLDFNVSQVIDCSPSDATLGGTLSYMSPEHLNAAITRDASSITTVNHRSDVYSLGLVLYEMLAGELPFKMLSHGSLDPRTLQRMLTERQQPIPSLKKTAPLEIPWSLESIVRKCLSPNPGDRYASAGQLAEDLNRFLADQPLKFAPELSRWEQVRKWIRRHPRLTSTTAVSLLAAAVIIPGIMLLGLRAARIQDADTAQHARNFEEGTQKSREKANTEIPNEALSHEGILSCKKTLEIYNVLSDPNWQEGIYWKRLGPNDRERLSESARELLLLLAANEVMFAQNVNEAAEGALRKLELAEQIRDLPPSKALLIDRARYLRVLKRDNEAELVAAQADKTPAMSTHDKYMQATALAREQTDESRQRAIDLLSSSIKQTRNHYWSHFERALVYQEMNEKWLAVADLGVCIGLWPKSSAAFFNRAHLLHELGRKKEAVDDYTAAIGIDGEFWSAYFNRGLVWLELNEYPQALADFDRSMKHRPARAADNAARALALAGLGRYADAKLEHDAAMKLAQQDSRADVDRIRWTYAFAIAPHEPQQARQLFEDVVAHNANHAQAHYGLGMLLMRDGKDGEAVREFDAAIQSDSQFMDPVRYRAIALARLGEFQEAAADADFSSTRELSGESIYVQACVAAIIYKKTREGKIAEIALSQLERAIVHGVRRNRAAEDLDFSALWPNAEFRKLTGTVPRQDPSADRL